MSYNFKEGTAITVNSDGSFTTKVDKLYLINSTGPITVSDESGTVLAGRLNAGKLIFKAVSEKSVVDSLDCNVYMAVGGAGGGSAELTAEQVKAVVPMKWNDTNAVFGEGASSTYGGTAIGPSHAKAATYGVAVGYESKSNAIESVAVGMRANANGRCAISVGVRNEAKNATSIVIGPQFTETVDGANVDHTCTTEGTGSITIGAGANTLNTTKTVDGVETTVESSNAITIGCKASNTGADSVVIGAQASGLKAGSVVMGAGAKASSSDAVVLGRNSNCGSNAVAVGTLAQASGYFSVACGPSAKALTFACTALGGEAKGGTYSTAVGYRANAKGNYCNAFGMDATANDYGATVIRSIAEDGTYTQLYFSGANTPLANTYEDGEAMMGYVVRDSAGNVMTDAEGNAMVGTQKLSVLFPNNRGENAFTPAALNLDEDWTPKLMFRPSDLDMPIEEPAEPEEYTPLPVYPIVEPEIEEIME